MIISEGSLVLFFFNSDKKWLIRVENEKKLHTHLGIIDAGSTIGLEYGAHIMTNKDKKIFLLPPNTYDFVMKSQRTTQIVYPKDYGYIAARTGLRNGSKVLEIGTGSAALSTFLASIVMPEGHVYTFDVNEDFMSIAKKNLEKSGMDAYVTQAIFEPEKMDQIHDVDLVVIDSWRSLELFRYSLSMYEERCIRSVYMSNNESIGKLGNPFFSRWFC